MPIRSGLVRLLKRAGEIGLLALAFTVDLLLWGFDRQLRFGGQVPMWVVVASGVATFAAVWRRTERPVLAYAAAWAYTVGWALLLPTYQPFTALLIALYQTARNFAFGRALIFLALTAIPWSINTFNTTTSTRSGFAGAIVTILVWCVLAGLAWTTGRFGYRRSREAELREAQQAAEAALALQNERLRLARELHDVVSHSVGAMVMQAAGALNAYPPEDPRVRNILQAVESTGTRALRELRQLLGFLHANAADGAPLAVDTGATLADLDGVLTSTRACDVEVRMTQVGQAPALDVQLDHLAYRLVQESLANVIKHQGRGATVDVDLTWTDDRLEITVRSRPGHHSQPPAVALPSGFGLQGLRARVEQTGGRFHAGWDADGSYLVSAELPLMAGPSHGRMPAAAPKDDLHAR